MVVKAKYYKEVEVVDEITEEEIDRIPLHGMPSRFDGMADQIDNEKPLEFNHWECVEDDKFQPPNAKFQQSNTKFQPQIDIAIGIIFAILFGLAQGIIKQDIRYGMFNVVLYILIWFPVNATINWVRKVNKHMKGEDK